ncbi:MAG: glutathione S-transferase family protein [Gammaproteobacteria bacterium]
MITLHQFPSAFGVPNLSPFCMKVETYLRMAGLPYRSVNANLRRAPKGKAPWIEDDGKVIADSGFILDYLKSKYGDTLDAALTVEQRAASVALTRLMEEHLYWAVLYARWMEEENWRRLRPVFFGSLPAPLRWFVPGLVRAALRRELRGHGIGRHRPEEIHALGCSDISALADFLGGKPYFIGEAPTSVDASAYAFLANVLWVPLNPPLQAHAMGRPSLLAYCERMRARYYPEPAPGAG